MSDADFRKWIQTLPSCLDGGYAEYINGDGRNPACHNRRAGESGIAYKAEFSCYPMTHEQHAYAHQRGELACLQRHAPHLGVETVQEAKDIFDAFVALYRERWFSENPVMAD